MDYQNNKKLYQIVKSPISYTFLEFLIVLLIIWESTSTFLSQSPHVKLFIFVFLVLIFIFMKKRLNRGVVYVFIIIGALIVIQGVIWEFSLTTFSTFSLFFVVLPYLAIKIVGIKYLKIASDIILISTLIALPLYFMQFFIPGFSELLMDFEQRIRPEFAIDGRYSILIYTIATIPRFEPDSMLRNFGMFHEPGAYAVFLVLAVTINLMLEDKVLSRKNTILLFALVTTFSTAGYLAMLMVFSVYFFYIKRKDPRYLVAAIIVLVPLLLYISNLPFMTAKIRYEYETQIERDLQERTSGRIFGARKALIVLQRYPLTGRGLTTASMETDAYSDERAGYGFMAFFARLGVILSITFIYFFMRGMKRVAYDFSGNQKYWVMLLSGLTINLFSQHFITTTFFIMLFYIGLLKIFDYSKFAADKSA